ncbi:MAG: Hsp20/alpha crystallin family protein [Deltaproteobacteria bacterium]|nr:Hsp20/alpha crystallin family protein [Deltaproteobacteria bacterium]
MSTLIDVFNRDLNRLRRVGDWGDFERFFDVAPRRNKENFVVPECSTEETDGHYLITLDMPGLKKEDIEISLENDHLSVKAERKREEKKESKGSYYEERSYGTFHRYFTLPGATDGNHIEALYKDGVLTIAVPKSEAAKPKKIAVGSEESGLFAKFVKGKKADEKHVA